VSTAPAVPPPASGRRHDRLTVAAIAVTAYTLANILHEGLGHWGACLLVHGVPRVWSAVHFGAVPPEPLTLERRTARLLVAAAVGAVFVLGLGPGVRLH